MGPPASEQGRVGLSGRTASKLPDPRTRSQKLRSRARPRRACQHRAPGPCGYCAGLLPLPRSGGPSFGGENSRGRDGISASAPKPGKGRPGEPGCARRGFRGMRAQGLQRSHNKGEILPPRLGLGSHQAPQRTGEGQRQERRVIIAASTPEPRLLPGAGAHPACRTLGRPRRIRGTSGVRRLGHHRRAGAPSPTRCPSRRGRWVPAGWAQGG